ARAALHHADRRRAAPDDDVARRAGHNGVGDTNNAAGGDTNNAADGGDTDSEREQYASIEHTHSSFLAGLVGSAVDDDVRQAEAMLELAEDQLRRAEKAAALP